MKFEHSTRVPHGHAELLQLIILEKAHLDRARSFLAENYDLQFELTEKMAEKGHQKIYATGTDNLLLVGIGEPSYPHEAVRRAVASGVSFANDYGFKNLFIYASHPPEDGAGQFVTAMVEAASLANYQFLAYKSEPHNNSLEVVQLYSRTSEDSLYMARGERIARATNIARDLVNEPLITLTAEEIAKRCEQYGEEFGFDVEVFNKARIKALKMGGLLAVNSGSIDPPTFTVMEWKPEGAQNETPVVLVGKGVGYDTGGLSLKPTANSMDMMKCDMAGAAAVIGAIVGVSAL